MKKFLRFLYLNNKETFYKFFIEDFTGEIPESVMEPAIKFLSTGGKKIEKWALFQAHFLQSRMETNLDKIKLYEGMLLMLKLIMVHAKSPVQQEITVRGTPDKPKPDYVKGVDDAISDFKKKKDEQLSTSKE